jgi:hypothetical protein
MKVRISIAALAVLAATACWGQSAAGSMPTRRSVAATSNTEGMAAAARFKQAASQQVQDMGATLAKMHVLLKNMQAKTSTASKDSVAKANLEMWSLMLDQLDKEYAQLAASQKAREDMEARRQAMYKQAEQKADAAAAAARAAQQAQAAAAPQATAPAAETQPAAAPSTPNPAPTSPN